MVSKITLSIFRESPATLVAGGLLLLLAFTDRQGTEQSPVLGRGSTPLYSLCTLRLS